MMYPHLIDIALLYAINTKQATKLPKKIPCHMIVVHCNPLNVNKGKSIPGDVRRSSCA